MLPNAQCNKVHRIDMICLSFISGVAWPLRSVAYNSAGLRSGNENRLFFNSSSRSYHLLQQTQTLSGVVYLFNRTSTLMALKSRPHPLGYHGGLWGSWCYLCHRAES